MNQTLELTVSRVVPAPQQQVFEAWLDPQTLPKFMLPAEGMAAPRVEIDAREGGSFLIVMKAGDQELPHRGEYKQIQKFERLVFTWISNYTVPDSTVSIDFEKLSERETKVTLHHVGFPAEEARANHEGGWARILETQGRLLG